MRVARFAVVAPVGALLTIAASSTMQAQSPDILGIWDQMVTSRVAAASCSTPDSVSLKAFESNFRLVTVRAAEEVKRRRPTMTPGEISALMSQRERFIASKVKAMVDSKGCSDRDIAVVVRRFGVQASWDAFK